MPPDSLRKCFYCMYLCHSTIRVLSRIYSLGRKLYKTSHSLHSTCIITRTWLDCAPNSYSLFQFCPNLARLPHYVVSLMTHLWQDKLIRPPAFKQPAFKQPAFKSPFSLVLDCIHTWQAYICVYVLLCMGPVTCSMYTKLEYITIHVKSTHTHTRLALNHFLYTR